MRAPKPARGYWAHQAGGWSAYLAYVLGGYFIFSRQHRAEDVISIVVFCTAVPVALTHGLRAWMYAHGWNELAEARRKLRELAAALLLGVVTTAGVGLANGVAHGRVWISPQDMGWMLLAYVSAFGSWAAIYDLVHARRRRVELEHLARDAQLRALRAQINPHFLFNSLNSVRSLIAEDPSRAASMVTGLSDVLRYSLASERKDTVPLAEELAIVDQYLGVERVRFDERLSVERAVDPSTLPARVPPMIVHTLAENAVKHGIAALPRGGIVRVESRVQGQDLVITVTNSGQFVDTADGNGLGLQNARERLRLLYGSRAALEVGDDGRRTVATLRLPLEFA